MNKMRSKKFCHSCEGRNPCPNKIQTWTCLPRQVPDQVRNDTKYKKAIQYLPFLYRLDKKIKVCNNIERYRISSTFT